MGRGVSWLSYVRIVKFYKTRNRMKEILSRVEAKKTFSANPSWSMSPHRLQACLLLELRKFG